MLTLNRFCKQLNTVRPATGIFINETEATQHKCQKLNFDPREKQQEFEGKRVQVYQCGEKHFAKLGDCCADQANTAQSEFRQVSFVAFNYFLLRQKTANDILV